MNALDKILKRIGPITIVDPPSVADWQRAETELGIKFPPDFVELINFTGRGWFGALVLRSPSPGADPLGSLSRDGLLKIKGLDRMLEPETGMKLFPSPGGLISIGKIDRQEFYYEPGNAPALVSIDCDSYEVFRFDCTLTEFIEKLAAGQGLTPWEEELAGSIWNDGTEPFFTAKPS